MPTCDAPPASVARPVLKTAACLAVSLAILATVVYETCLVFDLTRRTYGEGPILQMGERMRQEPIAASWMHELPYGLSCYGPAFYWATNAVTRLTGLRHSFVPGRIVALACGLAIAALLGITAYRRTHRGEIGLLAAAMFLLSVPVMEWFPFARVDTLAMVFVAAAFLAIGPGWRGLLIAAVCIAAGSLAKPTAALAAVPIGAHLLATGRYRESAWFACAVAVFGAVAWGIVQRATGGFFLTAVLLGNSNPMSLWKGYSLIYQFLLSPLGTGAAITVSWLMIASPRQFARSLYSLGFATSLVVSTVIACKRGSDINYFLEPAMLASLAVAIDGFPRLFELNVRRATMAAICLACAMALPNLRETKTIFRELPRQPQWTDTVKHWLADQPADVGVLADGRLIDMVLMSGHQPLVNDPYLYTLLVENGTLDSAPIMDRMRDGRLQWLFLHRTLPYHLASVERYAYSWPREVLDALPRYYELVDEDDGLYVYRRRGEGIASRAKTGTPTPQGRFSDSL